MNNIIVCKLSLSLIKGFEINESCMSRYAGAVGLVDDVIACGQYSKLCSISLHWLVKIRSIQGMNCHNCKIANAITHHIDDNVIPNTYLGRKGQSKLTCWENRTCFTIQWLSENNK